MDFSEALQLLKQGKFVYRTKWRNNNKYSYHYIGLKGKRIYGELTLDNKKVDSPYVPSHEDLLATDWELYIN